MEIICSPLSNLKASILGSTILSLNLKLILELQIKSSLVKCL